MPQSRSWRGVVAPSAFVAFLIAVVSSVHIGVNTVWSAPPRFDGAGYAVLARSLLDGNGYRAVDHPDRPRHGHFPPMYPLVLALTWGLAGISVTAAHALSILLTVGATLMAWTWFRSLLPRRAAALLGLALAVNWIWGRTGGAIQSEPLYLFASQAALLMAAAIVRRPSPGNLRLIGLGALLAACVLTRQVALGLAAAVCIDLVTRRRFTMAATLAVIVAVLVLPWLVWMASVGPLGRTQADLLVLANDPWSQRLGHQLVFYCQRISDQIIGPFVEVGTISARGQLVLAAANIWSVAATALIAAGWLRCIKRPRRRLAGLLPLCTLAILIFWPYTEAGRFLIPLVPCLLVGAVEGAVGAGRLARRISGIQIPASRIRVYASGLIVVSSLPYSAYAVATGRARALESYHRPFDMACSWIAVEADQPGPVISRHPGEVFWQTGRQGLELSTVERPGDVDADFDSIARLIAHYHVAYLLVDQNRYAGAAQSPLAQFLASRPRSAREVWRSDPGLQSVIVYEVARGAKIIPGP